MDPQTVEMANRLREGCSLRLYLQGMPSDQFVFIASDLEKQVGMSLEIRQMADSRGEFFWVWRKGLPTPPQIRFLEGVEHVSA